MSYKIIDTITNKTIEGQHGAHAAFRGCVVLNAHELKNGRVWRYAVEPPVEPIPFEKLHLPDWVLNALNKVIDGG